MSVFALPYPCSGFGSNKLRGKNHKKSLEVPMDSNSDQGEKDQACGKEPKHEGWAFQSKLLFHSSQRVIFGEHSNFWWKALHRSLSMSAWRCYFFADLDMHSMLKPQASAQGPEFKATSLQHYDNMLHQSLRCLFVFLQVEPRVVMYVGLLWQNIGQFKSILHLNLKQ